MLSGVLRPFWEARGFCSAFPGLDYFPGTQCPGAGYSPRSAFVRSLEGVSLVTVCVACLVVRS